MSDVATRAKSDRKPLQKVPAPASCSNCRWRGRDFRCHYNPPQMGQVGFPEWPVVKDHEWCGKHEKSDGVT